MKTTTMKQIFLLLAVLLTFSANAQSKIKVSAVNQKPAGQNTESEIDAATQLGELDQRVASLLKDIDSLYGKYEAMQDKWFKNSKDITAKTGEMTKQQKEQQERITEATKSIDSLAKEMAWIEELRTYYEKGTLDDLYRGDGQHPCADVTTLELHRQLLGENYPKEKFDDLMLLAESAASVKKEFDAKSNSKYRERLRKMTDCDTKWSIDGLLAVHGDIKEEVDKWDFSSQDDTSPLMCLIKLRTRLMNEYGVDLDADFPYLAEQARAKAGLSK